MKTTRLHISQTSFMPSLLKSLREKGVTVDKYLKQSKLIHFNLNSHENYVPNLLLYDFMYKVQRSQGLYSLVNQFQNDFKLKQSGPFGEVYYQQPNLLTALQNVVKMPYVFRTNHILNLGITGSEAFFAFQFTDHPSKERTVLDDVAWAQVFDGFRAAGGKDWTPTAIYTTNSSFERMKDIIPPGNYRIYYKQKFDKIVFPTNLLFNGLTDPDPDSEVEMREVTSYTEQVNKLLNSTAEGTVLSLNDISDYTNLPTRTIKRKLAEEGSSFSQLSSNVFFSKAARLLSDTNLPVKIIAQQLAYNNTANFTRAFKNMAQVSPEAFRAQA